MSRFMVCLCWQSGINPLYPEIWQTMKIWALLLVFASTCYLPVGADNGANSAAVNQTGTSVLGNGAGTSQSGSASSPYNRTYTRSASSVGATTSQGNASQRTTAGQQLYYGANSRRTVPASSAAPSRSVQAGKSYDFSDSVSSSGVKRSFIVHVPASYTRTHSMPVVFAFHGLGMSGSMMMYLTNFDYYADKLGFIAVYPNANNGRWDDGHNAGSGDVQFVNDMIAKLSSEVNVDQRRVYAAGISNGGHFVQYLAGQSRRIAAIAVVSSSVMANAASSAGGHRMPIVLFIGTDDPLVPSSDPSHNATLGKLGDAVGLSGLGSLSEPLAKIGGLMTAEETVEFWCKNNGCSQSPYTVQMPDKDLNDGTKVTRYSYGGYGSEVVFYSIHGGGHSWPGSLVSIGAKDILGRTSLDVNASELIADFFMHH